jgi:hypothetical protein
VGESKLNATTNTGTPPAAVTFSSLLSRTDMRFPLAIGLGLQLAQQFSGVNAVFYYSSSFFERAHVEVTDIPTLHILLLLPTNNGLLMAYYNRIHGWVVYWHQVSMY